MLPDPKFLYVLAVPLQNRVVTAFNVVGRVISSKGDGWISVSRIPGNAF